MTNNNGMVFEMRKVSYVLDGTATTLAAADVSGALVRNYMSPDYWLIDLTASVAVSSTSDTLTIAAPAGRLFTSVSTTSGTAALAADKLSLTIEDVTANVTVTATSEPIPLVVSGTDVALGTDYSYDNANGVLTILSGKAMTVSMAAGVATTADRIAVNAVAGGAKLTLNAVTIDTRSTVSALTLADGASLTLTLSGANTLAASGNGVELPNAALTVNGGGSLYVYGGCAIRGSGTASLTFAGGTVTAEGAADGLIAKAVTVSGGAVTAAGDNCGVSADTLSVSAGSLTANGDYAAIAASTSTTVTGGTLTAESGSDHTTLSGALTVTSGTVRVTNNNSDGQALSSAPTLSGYTATHEIAYRVSGLAHSVIDPGSAAPYTWADNHTSFYIKPAPIEAGDFAVTGASLVTGTDLSYDSANGVLTIHTAKPMTISMKDGWVATSLGTDDRIVVDTSGAANLTLNGVKVHVSRGELSPMRIAAGTALSLTLAEGTQNDFIAIDDYNDDPREYWNVDRTAVEVPAGASLTISGGGGLAGLGNSFAAGIGARSGSAGAITVADGSVNGRSISGVGIGGTNAVVTVTGGAVTVTDTSTGISGETVSVSGGTVTLTCVGTGISGNVTVSGGTVTATGVGNSGSITTAQRSRSGGLCGSVLITGGTVEVSSSYGAGLAGTVEIRGGTVTATSEYGAGIGGECGSVSGSAVTISGGTVEAASSYGAGIGAGYYGVDVGDYGDIHVLVNISGGTVTAASSYGAGVGGGQTANGGTSAQNIDVHVTGGTLTATSVNAAAVGLGSGGVAVVTGSGRDAAAGMLVYAGGDAATDTLITDLAGTETVLPRDVKYIKVEPGTRLATPTGLAWDADVPAKAKWDAVTNAAGYSVQLYKDGVALGGAVSAATAYYDLTALTAANGSYTFTVTALSPGAIGVDVVFHSLASEASAAYVKHTHDWDTTDAAIQFCSSCRALRVETSGAALWIDGALRAADAADDYTGGFLTFEHALGAGTHVLTTYTYHDGAASAAHTNYPTGMRVWLVTVDAAGNTADAETRADMTDLLGYAGTSIRLSGEPGIRMITQMDISKRAALLRGTGGWTLVETGTVAAWAATNGAPTLGAAGCASNFAYKQGALDAIFKRTGGALQYTNVLVGYTDPQCLLDFAMRPYAKLQNNATNELVTIYGGVSCRSIQYVAQQNAGRYSGDAGAYIDRIIALR